MSDPDLAAFPDLQALSDAVATFATAKKAYTARLAVLVGKINAGQAVSDADWADLVSNVYDPVTAASNDVRTRLAALFVSLSGANELIDTTLPAKMFNYSMAYTQIANYLCFLPDKATALGIVDLIAADLKLDTAAYYDAVPPPSEAQPVIGKAAEHALQSSLTL